MIMNKKSPVRTCVACRKEFPKDELLRVVCKKDGVVALDKSGKADGRGAYICSSDECLKKIMRTKMLSRIFGTPVPEELYKNIEESFVGK